jgi:S1-C subfamily serine protease
MSDSSPAFSLEDLSNSFAGLAERVAQSTLAVHGRSRWSSSGFIWRQGLVVTAEEALETDEELSVTRPDGTRVSATLVGRDPSTDIAVLKIEDQQMSAAPFGSTAGLKVGHLALAVGRRREGPGAALGIVALAGGPWQSLRGGRIDRTLHLDLRLDPRLEGGAVVDASGRVAGMAVLGPRHRVLVIPTETIERVAQQLLERGRIARGYLGLGLQPVRIDQAAAQLLGLAEPRGLMVISVDPDGPGHAAGLRQGDTLVRWNGEPLRSVHDAHARLGPESVGQSVELGIVRAGEGKTLTVEIRERPKPQ